MITFFKIFNLAYTTEREPAKAPGPRIEPGPKYNVPKIDGLIENNSAQHNTTGGIQIERRGSRCINQGLASA